MGSPRTSTLSAAQRRHDDWRLSAFEMLIADEASRRREAKQMRRALQTGALVGLIFEPSLGFDFLAAQTCNEPSALPPKTQKKPPSELPGGFCIGQARGD